MKEKYDCFVKKVCDRKTSKVVYEVAVLSKVEVKTPGQAQLSSLKKTIFCGDEEFHLWTRNWHRLQLRLTLSL